MKLAARSLLAATILACGLAPCGASSAARAVSPPATSVMAVVSAGEEAAAVNPGRRHRRGPEASTPPADFKTTMDRTFGEGAWRQTSGFRTRRQENALRRAGAGTVAVGHLSRHSIGDRSAPGAYDAVVAKLSLAAAAAKLKQAGAPFAKIAAERAHGREGPHLHIELVSATVRGAPTPADN
jgi:hypothetical protein